MERSFSEGDDEKIALAHERVQSQRMELVAQFERTPEGLLAGIERYYEYEKSAIEKYGPDGFGRIFLVIFDFSLSDAEIDFIAKGEDMKIRRATTFIQRLENFSIVRPVLASNVIYLQRYES